MIEKTQDNHKISQLHIIIIYQTNYNIMLKLFWPKKVIQWSEDNNLMKGNQWDTRPNKSAEIVVIIN